MSVNSTNTLRFTITAVDNLTRAAMTESMVRKLRRCFGKIHLSKNRFIKG